MWGDTGPMLYFKSTIPLWIFKICFCAALSSLCLYCKLFPVNYISWAWLMFQTYFTGNWHFLSKIAALFLPGFEENPTPPPSLWAPLLCLSLKEKLRNKMWRFDKRALASILNYWKKSSYGQQSTYCPRVFMVYRMWREIRLLAASKPVIASMSDVAASGGYYMAMAAGAIVSENLTLTGSIGVVAGEPKNAK